MGDTFRESIKLLASPGPPACCEPAGERITAPEGSPIPDKWLQAHLGGIRIWYRVAALTSRNVMGEIPSLPEVNGNLVVGSSRARTSPSIFPSLLPGECVRSGSLWPRHAAVWKPFTEPGGIAALLGTEIQWEALPVFSWVGTTRGWTWRPRRPLLLAGCSPQWG